MIMESVLEPKQPIGKGWVRCLNPPLSTTRGYPGQMWTYLQEWMQGLSVISAVEVAHDQNDIDKGPEYHISINKEGAKCSENEARFVLKAFNMEGADEDNHGTCVFPRNFCLARDIE